MKKLIVAGLFLAAGVVALTGFAGGCGHHGGHGRHDPARMAAFVTEHVDDTLDDLEATPAQRERIHAVKDRMLERAQAARAGHAEARAEVLAQWKAETPDAARLHALVDARVEAMRAIAHEAVEAGLEVHGTLTPEQRAELTSKIERRMR